MNPFTRFRNWIIGDALAATDDVFGKARIRLIYNFSCFMFVMGAMFTGNLISGGYTWEIIATLISTFWLFASFYFLKKSKVNAAAIVFASNQAFMSTLHFVWQNGRLDVMSCFWLSLFILYMFFVFGRWWGIVASAFIGLMILAGMINTSGDWMLFHFEMPPEQKLPETPFVVFIPFLLNIYIIYQFVKTRNIAEVQLNENKLRLQSSNRELETKNKDITDSINYAQRIQYAVLPGEDSIYRSIPLSFILYKPKNIVSGDFFWFHEIDAHRYILVTADCTGHGVPGALMTVIGSNLLNQVIIENRMTKPSEILSELDRRITITLKQEKERLQTVHDGMDLALVYVDKSKKEFIVTSAKRPSVFIRNRVMQELKGSKFTLGGMRTGEKHFDEIRMNYQEDDVIYFFTDGYADQFGGEKGKKFSNKRLRETFQSIHQLPMNEQKQQLDRIIETWKGNLEQVDDICVIGIRF